jgi:hypothetical protein
MGRRLSQLCPPYATPSSNSSLDYRRSDARIVENGFATSGMPCPAPRKGEQHAVSIAWDGREAHLITATAMRSCGSFRRSLCSGNDRDRVAA